MSDKIIFIIQPILVRTTIIKIIFIIFWDGGGISLFGLAQTLIPSALSHQGRVIHLVFLDFFFLYFVSTEDRNICSCHQKKNWWASAKSFNEVNLIFSQDFMEHRVILSNLKSHMHGKAVKPFTHIIPVSSTYLHYMNKSLVNYWHKSDFPS